LRISIDKIRIGLARLVVVGDSLAACCPWNRLDWTPFGAFNLARGGARLEDIARQLDAAPQPRFVLADGGLNDLLGDGRSPEEIHRHFVALLDGLAKHPRAMFTLMPHVSDPTRTRAIDAANALISESCRKAKIAVLDLNPWLSQNGVRRSEMTDDGLHFTSRANDVWIAAVRRALR
jgi:lysophospholipase L1-like esterase